MNEIDDSIQSVLNQNYDKENIYITIMDFGSTDGTYEKLLTYDRYHLGVYRNYKYQNPRLRISHMWKLAEHIVPNGKYSFQTILYPGNVLYPNFMKVCTESFIRNWGKNPRILHCSMKTLKLTEIII